MQFNSVNENRSIMLTPSAHHATPEKLDAIVHPGSYDPRRGRVLPAYGRNHYPVNFAWLLRFVMAEASRVFPGVKPDLELVLNVAKKTIGGVEREGFHMLAILRYGEPGQDGLVRVIALRTSDNQDFGVLIATMAEVSMCCNGLVWGGGITIVKKNTTHNLPQVEAAVCGALSGYEDSFERLKADRALLESKPIGEIAGAELLGRALYGVEGKGSSVLTPTQANIAREEWRTPGSTLPKVDGQLDPRAAQWQEAWRDRSYWTLYQAVTEGLKKGNIAGRVQRHAAAHGFMMAAAQAA